MPTAALLDTQARFTRGHRKSVMLRRRKSVQLEEACLKSTQVQFRTNCQQPVSCLSMSALLGIGIASCMGTRCIAPYVAGPAAARSSCLSDSAHT